MIESNRYRKKTSWEELKEAEALERIKREQAKKQQLSTLKKGNYFICSDCGEQFTTQVWHCPVCKHHWQMHLLECGNCHEYKRPDVQNSSQRKTRQKVAKSIGTSHDTLHKVKTIAAEKLG